MSFYTRHIAMEICFGDVQNEEENIAYSTLKAIKKVSITTIDLCIVKC